MELLIGCGNSRQKKLWDTGREHWNGLVTLDIDRAAKPDRLWDLHNIPLPFDDNSLDEIHAYEVLEHVGRQGDYRFFFDQFADFWRMLKPDGMFFATVPMWDSVWAWGDPGHSRVINKGSLVFLNQPRYGEVGDGKSPMTDYRGIYKADFDHAHMVEDGETMQFALRAIKPARIR